MNRGRGFAVPDNGGLPLVGDADAGDARGRNPGGGEGSGNGFKGARPDLSGVMLDPSRLWVVLGEFGIGFGEDVECFIDKHHRGAGGALIDGENDVFLHDLLPPDVMMAD